MNGIASAVRGREADLRAWKSGCGLLAESLEMHDFVGLDGIGSFEWECSGFWVRIGSLRRLRVIAIALGPELY